MANISGLRNPYDYANPVRADEYFAGRSAELAKINYMLDQAGMMRPVGYLTLYGKRAAGKTSLLNMTEKLAAGRNYLVARVNLVPSNAEPALFFATVYEELIAAVAGVYELKSPDGRKITPRTIRRIIEGRAAGDDFQLEFPENLAHAITGGQLSEMALRNDLHYLMTLVGRPVVLLIDEAQLIANRPDVLSILRTLGMRLTGYVLVLAGTPELVERINEVFDFLLRQFEFIKVERFMETTDVVQCITQPLRAIRLPPTWCFRQTIDHVTHDLTPLTDGNPYEIQLFCHVMFTRWQNGAADRMDLTAEAIDDVRTTLDVGNQHIDRPLINSIRHMSEEKLLALNVWCSSLEHATVDQIRFASQVSGRISLDTSQLDDYLDQFVRDGLIELSNSKVRLIGDAAEHIYTRLTTVQRLSTPTPILLSQLYFRPLLTMQLRSLLRDEVLSEGQWLLRTCCMGMRPEELSKGILDLAELPDDREINHSVEYLYEIILKAGAPQALHLTTVSCLYDGTTATRWICSRADDDFDINANQKFVVAQERVAAIGGALRAERTTIPLMPMADMADWLVTWFADPKARRRIAYCHVSASYAAYSAGDIPATFVHLNAAFRLSPAWDSANNLAYLNLVAGDYSACREWATRAVPLTDLAHERALSRYNGAVAAALEGDWADARALLADAASDMEQRSPVEDDHEKMPYLMALTFDEHVEVHEVNDMELSDALVRTRDALELAERFQRLHGSA
jgi:AAA ATPase-like protein